ncbi:MAG: acyl-CoA thioesterase [Candidatus Cloacimonetes bacterium]|nr:acyl-CoA thioesterase [Candidatus Cloacimonadota bacterium]
MNLLFRLFLLCLSYPFQQRIGFLDKVVTKFRALPTDLDLNFHVNNGVYFSMMDLGRFDHIFRCKVISRIVKENLYPVVASQTIRFQKSIKCFQVFYIHTQVIGWDEKFIFLQQKFVDKQDDTIALAVVKARVKCRDKRNFTPSEVFHLCGINDSSPPIPNWVYDWIQSEEAMLGDLSDN